MRCMLVTPEVSQLEMSASKFSKLTKSQLMGKQGQRRRGTLERQVGSTLAAEALAISATCAASRTPA